jgi:phosphatidylglycerophosphate synthase
MGTIRSSAAGIINRFGAGAVTLMRRLRLPLTGLICRLLVAARINQSHLTLFRMTLLCAFYFVFVGGFFGVALAVMLTAWVLDCVDGDLARLLGNDNATGEFEDAFGDNLACLVFPLALISTGFINGTVGALFIFAAASDLWISHRLAHPENRNELAGFRPKGDLWLSLARKTVWVVQYAFMFFRLDFFNPVYIALSGVLCLSVATNYVIIVKERLRLL